MNGRDKDREQQNNQGGRRENVVPSEEWSEQQNSRKRAQTDSELRKKMIDDWKSLNNRYEKIIRRIAKHEINKQHSQKERKRRQEQSQTRRTDKAQRSQTESRRRGKPYQESDRSTGDQKHGQRGQERNLMGSSDVSRNREEQKLKDTINRLKSLESELGRTENRLEREEQRTDCSKTTLDKTRGSQDRDQYSKSESSSGLADRLSNTLIYVLGVASGIGIIILLNVLAGT